MTAPADVNADAPLSQLELVYSDQKSPQVIFSNIQPHRNSRSAKRSIQSLDVAEIIRAPDT